MKIINPDSIHISEADFIDMINAELDWEVIEKMLFEKHQFTMQDDVDYKRGDIVVYKDRIAYRFDFNIKVPLSVVFGRDGQCLEISTSGDSQFGSDADAESGSMPDNTYDLNSSYDGGLSDNTDAEENKNLFSGGSNEEQIKNNDSYESGKKNISKMAENLADMISEINQGDE